MDNKKKNNKRNFTTFRNKSSLHHFTGSMNSVSDVLGSYTGTPVNTAEAPDRDDLYPVQDADDL